MGDEYYEALKLATTDKHVQSFLQYLKVERQSSKNTIKSYFQDITQFITLIWLPDETSCHWEQVTIHTARRFSLKLQELKLARTSLQRKISTMRSFFKFLLREGHLTTNCFANITSPKVGRKLPLVLSIKEVNKLLDAPQIYWQRQAKGDGDYEGILAEFAAARDSAILEVIYSGGLRISEVVALN